MDIRVCPRWIGCLLADPLWRLMQNPEKFLEKFVKKGMTVADLAPGKGFFTIPMAKMVGNEGKIVAVDIRPKTIAGLNRNAVKAGVNGKLDTKICSKHSLNIDAYKGCVDFALAFAVDRNVPDPLSFFKQIHLSLKDRGRLLFVESAGHISKIDFENMLYLAKKNRFKIIDRPNIKRSYAVLLKKN